MTGIMAAMGTELKIIKNNMNIKSTEKIGPFEYTIGEISGVKCVTVLCGIGKVSSAICTQIMILKFDIDKIINVGVAGGIGENIKIGDIVLADNVLQHDFDTSSVGDRRGEICRLGIIKIPCDKKIVQDIYSLTKSKEYSCFIGTVMSGDQFIADKDKLNSLRDYFGGIACDMESGAIGQVCYMNNIPFCIIRAISDNANDEAAIDYEEFLVIAAERAAGLILNLISQL